MIKSKKIIFNLITGSILLFIVIRNNFLGYFFGDPMDSKLQITIQDHWFKWITGKDSFFDLKIFYPDANTLGYSDTLIIPGIVHTVLKFLGLGTIQSWQFSNILILFVGIFITYIFTFKLVNNSIISWIITFLFILSHTFLENLSGQPNTVNYLLFFIIPISILNLTKQVISKSNIYLNTFILALFTPFLAISTWYAFFLGFLFLAILTIFFLILNRKEFVSYLKKILSNFQKLNYVLLLCIFIIDILLWFLFASIYLGKATAAKNLWVEVSRTESTINNLISSFVLNSKFIPIEIKNRFLPDQVYVSIGLGSLPIALIFLVIILSFFFKKIITRNIVILFSSTIFYLLFFVSFNNNSLFRIFWNNFILFESIRYTYRANLYVSYFLILIGIYLLFKISQKLKNKVFIFILFSFVLINQWQEAPSKWRFSEYFNKEYETITKSLKSSNCKSFVVDSPGKGWWDDQLSGMQIMRETSIPTINGYSGDYPQNYLASDWSKDTQLLQIGTWLNQNSSASEFCRVTTTGIQVINSSFGIVHDKNFDVLESSENQATWSWALNESTYLRVLNFASVQTNLGLSFQVKLPRCSKQSANFSFQPDNEKISKIIINAENQLVNFEYKIAGKQEKYIKLSTDFKGCSVDNDPRKLFYQVQFE